MDKFVAFLQEYSSETRQIATVVGIDKPYSLDEDYRNSEKLYKALWDTGATHSTISAKVVRECGLIPTGMGIEKRSGKPDDETLVTRYLASLFLPDTDTYFGCLSLVEMECPDHDILIGMDIISLGDFCLSHLGKEVWFSFRLPSIQRFNLTIPPDEAAWCSCGKTKKSYRECCMNKEKTFNWP
jgi:hypothetical protein